MAKYKGPQKYSVTINEKKTAVFDHKGEYETEDKAEIDALDALTPTWIKRIDEPKSEPEEPVATADTADEAPKKPAAKRKASAK